MISSRSPIQDLIFQWHSHTLLHQRRRQWQILCLKGLQRFVGQILDSLMLLSQSPALQWVEIFRNLKTCIRSMYINLAIVNGIVKFWGLWLRSDVLFPHYKWIGISGVKDGEENKGGSRFDCVLPWRIWICKRSWATTFWEYVKLLLSTCYL